MIEKKIRYDINIEKPSSTKPVKQGGVLNYLGKQKTVSAPRRWRSSPKHPIAHLAYITKDEEKILVDLNLYNSLKGRPNKGPSGIMSLNGGGGGGDGGGGDGGGSSGGDGSSSGDSSGDSSGEGDSGPGGSDDGSGHGGPGGPGDSGPGGSDDGTGHGGPGPGADDGGYGGFGIGPNAEAEAAASNAAAAAAAAAEEAEVDMSMPAMQTVAEKAQAIAMSQMTPASLAGRAIGMGIAGPIGGVIGGLMGSSIGRGVTGPSDDTQEQSSVQTSAPSAPDGGGGITTINQFAPLYNPTTGDNTADAMRLRLNALLVQRPTSYGIPAANQLSNYNLLDLVNLRR